MNVCHHCGASVSYIIPAGDNRKRYVCSNPQCGQIHYQNPNIITGCLPLYNEQVLLCKRAIEPKYGLWTLPAGFLENGETTAEGAARESWEEAQAKLRIEHLYTVIELPHIHQVYFFYKAQLCDLHFGAGEESLDVQLFDPDCIPWETLAFSPVKETLKHYINDRESGQFPFRQMVLELKQGKLP